MHFNNTDMHLKGFFTTDSNSLVSSSKNDENIVNIRVGDYTDYFGRLFVVLSITLMQIMFSSFLDDETNEFESVVKNPFRPMSVLLKYIIY